MRMPLHLVVPLLVLGLAACDAGTPAEPDTTRLGPAAGSLSTLEQSLIDDLAAGVDHGAILDRDVGCAILTGFANPDGLVAFGILGPMPGPRGICPSSNFNRTNPDGSVDMHTHGMGTFFLLVFDPSVSFPSEGSRVRWNAITHEGGARTFNFQGTLSDGSRVRGHFAYSPSGEPTMGNALWVQGVGYIVGGPPGQ